MSVVKIIELVGSSGKSSDDAVQQAHAPRRARRCGTSRRWTSSRSAFAATT